MHGLYGVALIGARSGRVGGGGRYGRWGGRGAACGDGSFSSMVALEAPFVLVALEAPWGRDIVCNRTTERLTEEPTEETDASVEFESCRDARLAAAGRSATDGRGAQS